MTERTRPAHVLAVPQWTLIIHIVQAVVAIIILGLDAYGIRWIAYNALIFSLVVVSTIARFPRFVYMIRLTFLGSRHDGNMRISSRLSAPSPPNL
jgi:hypothetical protein